MDKPTQRRHLKRMLALEKKLHSHGKLTKKEHNQLKQLHYEHAGGFFDNILSSVEGLLGYGKKSAPQETPEQRNQRLEEAGRRAHAYASTYTGDREADEERAKEMRNRPKMIPKQSDFVAPTLQNLGQYALSKVIGVRPNYT